MKTLIEKDTLLTLVAFSEQCLKDIGGCDHSVGICCCTEDRALRDAKQAMSRKAGAQPFDDGDWETYAGATPWGPRGKRIKPDEQPIIRHHDNNVLSMVDAAGVTLVSYEDEEGDHWYDLPGVVFPCQSAAMAFLNGLPQVFNPDDYGFVPST